jgi:voltage-gated potassium channel
MRIVLRRWLRKLHTGFVHRPITVILITVAIFYLWASVAVMMTENIPFGQASALVMPAFLGELGGVEGWSFVTKVSVLVALIGSVASMAVITGRVTTSLVEFCRTGGTIVKQAVATNHILICGWSFQGKRIVRELLASSAKPAREIVILADRDTRPIEDTRVEFVKGDPTQDDSLQKAGVMEANSVIVLSDTRRSANEADAEALMIVLAVESLNRSVYSTVQIMNSDNRIHFERAHADEIICLDQMGGSFIVASATNHGVSQVVSELLTFNKGSEFYRCDALPDRLVGKKFSEVVQELAEKKRILLGFETNDTEKTREGLPGDVLHSVKDGTRVIVVNPQNEYRLRRQDALFLIAESEPDEL